MKYELSLILEKDDYKSIIKNFSWNEIIQLNHRYNMLPFIQKFLKKEDCFEPICKRGTPLISRIFYYDIESRDEIIKLVIKKGYISHENQHIFNINPLFFVLNNNELLGLFLENGFDPNLEDFIGNNIICQYLCTNPDDDYAIEGIKLMIEKGIGLNHQNMQSETMIKLVLNRPKILNFLIENGFCLEYLSQRDLIHIKIFLRKNTNNETYQILMNHGCICVKDLWTERFINLKI